MAIPTEFFCSLPFSTKRLSLRDKINFTVPHERFVRQREKIQNWLDVACNISTFISYFVIQSSELWTQNSKLYFFGKMKSKFFLSKTFRYRNFRNLQLLREFLQKPHNLLCRRLRALNR